MSFSSRSSQGKPYRNGHYGSNHYQRKGFLGYLFGSDTSHDYHRYPDQYPDHQNGGMVSRMITCLKCHAELPVGSKFCSMCGEKVLEMLYCISCGEKLSPNAKFCSKCGTKTNG